jgi:hypothetical protein
MRNIVRFNEQRLSNSIKSGGFNIGVDNKSANLTGFFNGITPIIGGYVIYVNKASGDPSIYTPQDDTGLINITKSLGGNVSTVTESLVWLNSQSNMTVLNSNYPSIVTDGLVLNLDAGFVSSYPKTGTTWRDLSGSGNNSTLFNGPTFSSDGGGVITFDGTNESVEIPQSSNLNLLSYTYSFWIKRKVGLSNSWLQFLQRSTSNRNPGIWFFISEVNRIHFSIILSNGVNTSVNPSGFFQNEWHHFTATVNYSNNNTTIIAYRNGVQVDAVFHNNVSPVLGTGGSYFGRQLMDITNLQIYNRALTPQEVLQNYYAGLQRFIPTDGLVFSLDAQNTNLYATSPTTAYDISSNSYKGSLVNGTQYVGVGGGSWFFDGINDSIYFLNPNNPGISTNFSINAWVYCTNVSGENNIVSKNGPYFMRITNSKVRFNVLTTSGWLFQNGTTNLLNNTWYFLSMVYDGSTFKGYINTNLEFSVSKTGTLPSDANLFIGYTPEGGEQAGFNGFISQVQIYHKALTQTEITTIFNATRTRYGV